MKENVIKVRWIDQLRTVFYKIIIMQIPIPLQSNILKEISLEDEGWRGCVNVCVRARVYVCVGDRVRGTET